MTRSTAASQHLSRTRARDVCGSAEFVKRVYTQANEICSTDKKATIVADHVLRALEALDLGEWLPNLEATLAVFKDASKSAPQPFNRSLSRNKHCASPTCGQRDLWVLDTSQACSMAGRHIDLHAAHSSRLLPSTIEQRAHTGSKSAKPSNMTEEEMVRRRCVASRQNGIMSHTSAHMH